jgi:hypothetical protein
MKKVLVGLLLMAVLMTGCTHALRITNEETFVPSQTKPSAAVKLGFLRSDDKLVNSVITEISLSTAIKEAKKDYQMGSEMQMDYISDLSTTMKFRASGQNFVITIPGFMIFTHAWLGYKYYVDIDTQSRLLDPRGKVLNETIISTPYEIRYTSFGRGAASSLIGWFTPGYGLLDIVPGIKFSSDYDSRATPEFIEKAKPSYNAFVSSKVIEQIAAVQNARPSAQNNHVTRETVALGDGDVHDGSPDHKFMVSVLKIEDGKAFYQDSKLQEVPEQTQHLLDKIAKNEVTPDQRQVKEVLAAFGLSGLLPAKDMASAGLYTILNGKIVTLVDGRTTLPYVARINGRE